MPSANVVSGILPRAPYVYKLMRLNDQSLPRQIGAKPPLHSKPSISAIADYINNRLLKALTHRCIPTRRSLWCLSPGGAIHNQVSFLGGGFSIVFGGKHQYRAVCWCRCGPVTQSRPVRVVETYASDDVLRLFSACQSCEANRAIIRMA